MTVEMIEARKNGIWVEAYKHERYANSATVNVTRYQDGSPVNNLDAGELREVGEMLIDVAEKMEE